MGTCIVQLYLYYIYYINIMSWLGKLLGKGKGKGYNQFKDEELEEFDVGAVALDAAIEAAEITAQSGKISDQIALLELLLKKKNQVIYHTFEI